MVWPCGAKYQIHFLETETIQGKVKDPPDSPSPRYAWLFVFLRCRLASKLWFHCSNRVGLGGMCPIIVWQSAGSQSPGPKPCHMGSSDIIHLAWISMLSWWTSAARRLYYGGYTLAWAKWQCLFIFLSPAEHTFLLSAHLMALFSISKENTCTSRYGGDSPVQYSAGAFWPV